MKQDDNKALEERLKLRAARKVKRLSRSSRSPSKQIFTYATPFGETHRQRKPHTRDATRSLRASRSFDQVQSAAANIFKTPCEQPRYTTCRTVSVISITSRVSPFEYSCARRSTACSVDFAKECDTRHISAKQFAVAASE